VGTIHVDDEDLMKYVVTSIAITNDKHKHIIAYRSPIFLELHQHHKSESVHVADVERMYAATLGTDNLRGGGIPSDGLDLEGSDDAELGGVSISSSNREYKCSTEKSKNREVRVSKRRRRKDDIPVVRASEEDTEVAGMGTNEVETTGSSTRRSERIRKPNIVTNVSVLGDVAKAYKDVCGMFAETGGNATVEEGNPTSTREALEGPYKDEWMKSIQAKNAALYEREVFEVVRKPKGAHLLSSRYIHVIKRKLGQADRRKTRLVVLGCGQRPGIDFAKTFAPVAKAASIRILLALAQAYKLHIHQMDMDTAFFYAPLEEEIYMRPPVGMEVGDDMELIEEIKTAFSSYFQMKDLGELQTYLGMRITRTEDALVVDQSQYARDVINRFARLLNPKTDKFPKAVPFYRDMKLTKTERMSKGQVKYAKNFPFQEVMGSLLYLAINTRPDIAYAVSMLCRFNNNPTFSACRCAVRLLYYVRRTLDYGIKYSGDKLSPEAWSDSDFGGDLDTRRSPTGCMFRMANGPVSWNFTLQQTLASSSMEAEYMASYDVVTEVAWSVGVCKEMGVDLIQNGPINVFMDNKSAIALANNPVFHKRSKHIDVKYHWLREKIAEGVIQLVYVRTDEQLTDIFTKGLAYPRFIRLVHRVRGYYDIYAISYCDTVAELFDSDSEYCQDLEDLEELADSDSEH